MGNFLEEIIKGGLGNVLGSVLGGGGSSGSSGGGLGIEYRAQNEAYKLERRLKTPKVVCL